MDKIKLKRANVVKEVDSEDRAKALEAKGFVRTDRKTTETPTSKTGSDKLQKELKENNAQLQEAKKKVQALETELDGTKEQLEAAVKKNKAVDKK